MVLALGSEEIENNPPAALTHPPRAEMLPSMRPPHRSTKTVAQLNERKLEMSRRLRTLGLTVLALCGLTAVMAVSAQANWLENGVEVAANKNVVIKAHTTSKLVVKALNLELRCTTLKSEGLKIIGKSATGEGKVAFSGCSAFQISDGKEQKNCKPSEPIVAGGRALIVRLATIMGNAASLRNFILLEPEAGKPFTTITLPELCALAETSDVTGSLVTECGALSGGVFVGEDCNVSRVEHLIRQTSAGLWKGATHTEKAEHELCFGENKAILDGFGAVELESKITWAGHV